MADDVDTTFSEYAAKRDKKLSAEGQEALEAFINDHVLENMIFDALKNEETELD